MQKNYQKIIGASAISIAAILWGLDGVYLTPNLYNLDIAFVVYILHLVPFLFMNIFLYKQYKNLKKFNSKDYLILILIALLGGAIGTLSIVKALFLLNFNNLSIVILLQKLQPIFAIFLAAIFLKETITKKTIFWSIIAIISSYFITFGFSLPDFQLEKTYLLAILYALIAALSFGSATVLGKGILKKYNFTTATFYRFGITTILMLIYVLFIGKLDQWKQITNINWIYILIISFTTGGAAIFLYYFGLKKIKASVATICELFFPLSAIVFDYTLNGHTFSTIQIVAIIVMLFSIFKISFSQKSKSLANL